MADGRVVNSSRSSTAKRPREESPVLASNECSTHIHISLGTNGNRTKLKWTGSFTELKSFVEAHVNLREGEWSRVNNNVGFHVLKINRVTISFYPGTQTLSIQGVNRDVTKKKILHLIGEDEGVRKLQQIQDGGTENRITGEEEEAEHASTKEDSDVSDDDREVDINGKVFGNYTAEEESSCSGCSRNESKNVFE